MLNPLDSSGLRDSQRLQIRSLASRLNPWLLLAGVLQHGENAFNGLRIGLRIQKG
jgi:hypothetical protein